ncbi:MAG: hypothetical protein ABI203_06370 [Mucilaginibacter sp.]
MPGNDLLIIDTITHDDGVIKASISINTNSAILKGHFTGQPVVPGACMLQTVKEVLESALNKPLLLKKAAQLKFISMIDPGKTKSAELEINYRCTENKIDITGKLIADGIICFKFQGTYLIY